MDADVKRGGGPNGARAAVREGLRRVVAAAGLPSREPADGRVRWRNRLLDEVGSDARPLVELLLRMEADGVVAQIPAGPLSPAAWAPARARLSFAFAAETFVEGESARWAVDAWGYALGAVDVGGLYVPPPAPAAPPAPAPAAVRPTPAAGRAGAPAVAYAPAATPAPPAFAGPPGKVNGRMRRAIARANAGPPPNPFPKNFDKIAGAAFVAMVSVAAAAMWVGIADRREAGGLEPGEPGTYDPRAEPVLAAAGVAPPPIAPLPGGPNQGAPNVGAPAVAAVALDSLRLRDGTVRTGVVERVTADGLVLRDPWSDTAARLDFDSVVEWRARRGAVLPVGAAPPAPLRAAPGAGGAVTPTGVQLVPDDAVHRAFAAPAGDDGDRPAAAPPTGPGVGDEGHAALLAGLGGRYTVRRHLLEVSGSESCGRVADAVRASSATIETLEHRPGDSTFALTSRPGLRGTVDDDGRFRTDPVAGERRGVQYRFRMVGQFLRDGFRAETESETRAVLSWGDIQRCRVSVALEAERLR